MLFFGLHSTSDDCQGLSIDSNSIHHPSPPKKMKCSFLDYSQILMISQVGQWTWTPSATPLQPKKMKCSFLEYVQLLMISLAGQWTWTPSATSLQPKKWNAHFWITFNSWWLAGLVDGLEPHLPPLSSHKNEMLIFGLRSTSDDQLDWSMDSNAIHHPSPAKNMKCLFLDNVQLLMISQGGRWTRAPSATPLQPKKMKCSFLDYVQLLMISPAGQWTQIPSATSLQPKKMKCSFLDYVQLLMISPAGQWNQIPSATSLQPKKWNVHFWITFNFWWLVRLVDGLEPHPPPISSQENEMLIFGLCSTSDDQPGWSMDSNPICHPSPAKNMKCLFLDYIQLLMFSWIGQWTRMPSTTPLQPKKIKCSF